jgi:hypothetical protein
VLRTHAWILALLLVACAQTVPTPNATFFRDAPATTQQTNNGLVLRKELDAYKTFGGYDVAYTGQTAQWTFAVPETSAKSARLVLSMIADDHATPVANYRYTLWTDALAHDTPVPLPHGAPAISPFNNWIDVSVPVEVVPGESLRVSLTNASTTAPLDWIAVRSIELRFD